MTALEGFRSSKGAIGIALVLVLVGIALLAPLFIPAEFATQMDMRTPVAADMGASAGGTDQLGRNLMYRALLGAQTSIMIATLAVAISVALGLPIGVISGYFGGVTDNVLMRGVDTLLSFPALLLALTVSAVLGPNVQNTIIAIGVAFTPFLARASGSTHAQMILRHILPNIVPALIVQATISLAFAILAEAALSFLGLGAQPPRASWGLMIQASRDYLDVAPWTALVPGAAVALTVLGLNVFGDVLRDVLDPRTR